MDDFPFPIVGFDLDGTLIDTAGDLLAATNHALALADIAPLTLAQIRTVIGAGARQMLKLGITTAGAPAVGEPLFERIYAALLDHYAANIAVHSRPFAGAVALLDSFDAMGVRYGVVTNKSERLARLLLGQLGLSDRMSAIIGGDTLATRKPDPAGLLAMQAQCGGPAQPATAGDARPTMAFVGDSHFDIDAARAAAIPSVACSFGYMMQPVETLGADAIIGHFDELIPALAALSPLQRH
jgi:phosphoglycolate phosphatase